MIVHNLFYELDYMILSLYHQLAEAAGSVLTPVMFVISLTGKSGLMLIAVSVVLIFFKKTRKIGICCLGAIAVGALFTNLTIKPLIARPRPFIFSEEIEAWWQLVGAEWDPEFSFPSGHTTAACAFSSALCLSGGRKFVPWAAVYVLLMGASRNYLMMHYPSDVLGAVIIGLAAAFITYFTVSCAYKLLEGRKE